MLKFPNQAQTTTGYPDIQQEDFITKISCKDSLDT